MIKTHLQSQAAKSIAVGHQHNHEGTWQALIKISREQGVSFHPEFFDRLKKDFLID